jgi:hypothetical protein
MHAARAPLLDAPPLVRYGLPEYVRRDNPAAGAEFTEELGGNYFVRLVSLFVRIVTNATVATRTLRLEYRDAADNVYHVNGNPVTYPASSTEDFAFSAFHPHGEWEVSATNLVPLAPLLLPPTHDFHIEVTNIQVGDQLSAISFVWERFYTSAAPADLPNLPS